MGLLIATALASLVFAIDIFSGSEIRVYPLYFAAIALAGIIATHRQTVGFAMLCGGLWLASKYLDGTEYSSLAIWAWNTLAQTASFLLVAILVQKLNASLKGAIEFSEQLASRNAALGSKSIELETANSALNAAMHAIADADRIARHDLKTPLNNIVATVALLMSRPGLTPDESQLLSGMKGSARRALAMVNLSLALHQIEEGRFQFAPAQVDLKATAEAAVEDLKSHADTKNVSLVLACDSSAVMAVAHPEMSYSLIANILKNAIEAAPEASEVQLLLAQDASWATLSVINRGAMPIEIRDRFFSKYATHGKSGGSGLGAYSARLMAEAMGGSLTMTTSADAGTNLTLRLKSATTSDMHRAPTSRVGARTASIDPNHATAGGIRVLIVDDDEYNRLVLSRMLPDFCGPVATAINGRVALDQIKAERPDVVFLDINMPVMGGIEALGKIRACQAELGHPPSFIVAFSAIDDPRSSAAYLAQGFDACLDKPSSPQQVATLLAGQFRDLRTAHDSAVRDMVRIDAELAPMLDGFKTSRSALLHELIEALEAEDPAAARSAAHQLGGSLGVFGFAWASLECKAIEAGIDTGNWATLTARARSVLEHLNDAHVVPALPIRPNA